MVQIQMMPVRPEAKDILLSNLDEVPLIQFDGFVLTLNLDEPDEETKEVARKELRETPDTKAQSIKALRELLKDDKKLNTPYDNDEFLIRFLRPCKFYPDSAYSLIQRYYSFKAKHRDLYDGLSPTKAKPVLDADIVTVFNDRDQCGRRILVVEIGKRWKQNKISLDEILLCAIVFIEIAMLEPVTQINGAVVVFDMDGLSLAQVSKFTPGFAKRLVDLLQDHLPLRLKNLHIVNQPYIFNMVFALFKPFLKEKLKSRLIFHGTDRKSLHKYVSPKHLPSQYGGTQQLPRVTGSQWYELISIFDAEFEAINKFGYDK